MKIVFDLDGVLRDLNTYLYNKYSIPYPQNWLWKHDNKDIFEWVGQDYQILLHAPETEYCSIVRTYIDNIEIWTCQPPNWRDKTQHWINKHLGTCKVRFLSTKEKEERLDFLVDHILVEDSPNFESYSKIALIDRPYNQHIKANHRICKPEELKELCLMRRSEQHLKV